MTQAKVAERIGSQVTTISRYESGKFAPDMKAAEAITELFGYAVGDLKKKDPRQRERRLTAADAARIAEAVASGELDMVEADGRKFYVPSGLTAAQLASVAAQLQKK